MDLPRLLFAVILFFFSCLFPPPPLFHEYSLPVLPLISGYQQVKLDFAETPVLVMCETLSLSADTQDTE